MGLARTESEKIQRGHRLRKNGEEELREEARGTGSVPKEEDSSRIEGDKRELVRTMEMRQELNSQEDQRQNSMVVTVRGLIGSSNW